MNATNTLGAVLAAVLASTAAGEPAVTTPQPAGFESAEPLTAERLAQWVIEANPALDAVQATAEAAAHRIEPAGSLEDPMLSYGVAPLTAGANRSLNQTIDLSQKIPWPGTLAAREAAARHEAAAAASNAESLRLQVVARAKSAYAEWRYVHSALDVLGDVQALLDDLLATAETLYAAGEARQQDVLQVEVEQADLENRVLRLLRQRATVQARINALLNRAPDAALPAAAPISPGPPPPPLEMLQTLARTNHPELSRLDAELSASQSRVTLAEKAFFPNFQIGVGYDSLWDPVEKRPVFGVSINLPFDRSKRRADLDRARAEARRAQFLLSERRAELLADVAAARAQVVQARKTVALYRDRIVPLAAQYLSAAISDYRSGAGAFLNVITAEQRKLETDLELARALSDYARRRAELERWAGGSLDVPLPISTGAEP